MLSAENYENRWYCVGRLLPEGHEIEFWVANGTISYRPLPNCKPLLGKWICPGLMDGHVHISWTHDASPQQVRRELVRERRQTFSRQGTIFVRDMGAVDTLLMEKPLHGDGLTHVLPCGTMVIPYDGFSLPKTEADSLLQAFVSLAKAGVPWIKVFADWTNDFGGPLDTGFSGKDLVSYPVDILSSAVSKAKEYGSRVAAHAFTPEGLACAVAANVDSIEHGWGVDEEILKEMGKKNIAWLPLLSIAPAMRQSAEKKGELENVAWIDSSLVKIAPLLQHALDVGVPLITGTDWGPGLTTAQEIIALHNFGLSAKQALCCATTTAHDFFAVGKLGDGCPASFLIFEDNPLDDLHLLHHPKSIVIDGHLIAQ